MNEYETDWEPLYRDDFTPWDTGQPASHLIDLVCEYPIKPCTALDVGCGTGESSIWLARHGFKVTGMDLSTTAIDIAKSKSGAARCRFLAGNFLAEAVKYGKDGLKVQEPLIVYKKRGEYTKEVLNFYYEEENI